MRGVNWRVVGPLLVLGVFLVWRNAMTLYRGSHVDSWLILSVLVGLLVVIGFVVVVLRLRRRKSNRTWDLMLQADPDSTHFIAFVYPTVKAQLVNLGWRIHGSAYMSVPAIGIGISATAVTFWEAGVEGPTLTLTASDLTSVTVAPVSDGYRSHPAIQLRLNTENRNNRLQLNLRDAHHHNLSPAGMNEARDSIPVRIRPAESP
jgi:hypothetical protein